MIQIEVLVLVALTWRSALGQDEGSHATCPSPEDIKPCTCDNANLRCFSNHDFDIEQIFRSLSQGKSDDELKWNTFEISSPLLTELKDSIFHGVSFKTIKFVHCSKLNCIAPAAFFGMERTIENFVGYDTSFSGSNKPGCNLFDALRRIRSLRAINITGSRIREVPDNAFHETSGSHAQLTHIDLSGTQGGEITRVGRNAFASLKALKYIDLSQHQIAKVESHAFYFEDPSNEYLTINLEQNQLTAESFDSDSFAINGRITTVKLGGNSKIEVLKESVFRSFLVNTGRSSPNEQNIVDLRGSPLTCNKPNMWLLNNKFKLQRKLIHVISAESGVDFWRHTPGQCDK